MVFLKTRKLIRKSVNDINGLDMHLCTTVGQTRLKIVSVSFDVTKFPFQFKEGFPENHVCFAGKKIP